MAAALSVVRSLFAVASQGATGVFRIQIATSISRLELEQGFVHAMANVADSARGEEALVALLGRLPDESQPHFEPRAPRSPRWSSDFAPSTVQRWRRESAWIPRL